MIYSHFIIRNGLNTGKVYCNVTDADKFLSEKWWSNANSKTSEYFEQLMDKELLRQENLGENWWQEIPFHSNQGSFLLWWLLMLITPV